MARTTGRTLGEKPAPEALKDQAFAAIRALILSGDLETGSFISERQMVERLSMSKTPIRVAFERLARDGFVDILPQRGVRVRPLTAREITDHYDLRIAIESWVVRRAADCATPEDIDALLAHIERQRAIRERVDGGGAHPAPDDVTDYVFEDGAFHATLAAMADNAEVIRILENQRARLARVIAEIMRRDRPVLSASIAEHQAIVDALVARDGEAAAQAMTIHLERGKALLERRLAEVEVPA